MTIKEALATRVETLTDEEAARVLGYIDSFAQPSVLPNGTRFDASAANGDEPDDELTHLTPRAGFAAGSGLWKLAGFIKSDGPTDMAENHDKYLAEAYADLHEE